VKGKWYCDYCGEFLNHYHPETGKDTYWCPDCVSWRWIGYQIEKRLILPITYLAPTYDQSLVYLCKKLDEYEKEARNKLNSNVKIYSSKDCSQEFLYNLIPSKKVKS
jgi:hypothetical protein